MKKNLLSFSAVLFAFITGNAQITVTSADVPTAGTFTVEAVDTSFTTVSLTTGANQTWDYSTWQNQKQDTTSFVNPASLPGSSDFPGSNLAIDGNLTSPDIFLNNSTNKVEILGLNGDFGFGTMSLKFNPTQTFLNFPTTFSSTFNGAAQTSMKFPGQAPVDSIKVIITIIHSSDIDGWGTITTPAYSNVNSLRQKYTEIHVDSTFMKSFGTWSMVPTTQQKPNPGYDTTIYYRWFSNTQKGSIAEIRTDQNDVVIDAKYLLSTQIGINESSSIKNEVNIFPNPAGEKIFINGVTTLSKIIVFDAAGRLVENTLIKKPISSISVSGYENGLYFFHVVDMNGTVLKNGKFSVAR